MRGLYRKYYRDFTLLLAGWFDEWISRLLCWQLILGCCLVVAVV